MTDETPIPPSELITQTELAEETETMARNVRVWFARNKIPGLVREKPALFDRRVAVPAVLELEAARKGRSTE